MKQRFDDRLGITAEGTTAGGWTSKAGAALSSISGTVEGVGASVKGFSSMIGGVVAPIHVDDKNASALIRSDKEEDDEENANLLKEYQRQIQHLTTNWRHLNRNSKRRMQN